jgi:FKBP-type peptidyl-prolyl cis-trans isomerase FkpA/FKBP-type peptidyl-prolyl cis-trans isomerase FklB
MGIAIPVLAALSLFAAQAIAAAPEPKTEAQKTLYALGLAMSGSLAPFKLTEAEHGTLTSGAVFDSSVQRGQPASFPLNQVIPCWTEGLQRMKIGEKGRLVCPSDLAYRDRGRPPQIPPGATLIFEVELLDIAKQ